MPEDERAYGLTVCGAAIGEDEFVAAFLRGKEVELCGDATKGTEGTISSVSSTLAARDAHVASVAIYYSLQTRVDYLLATHLPRQTRGLAKAVDRALRGAYTRAFDSDVLCPEGEFDGQLDPTFTRDRFSSRARDGGGGFRPTEERFVFLNGLNNILPQMGGKGERNRPPLWPQLEGVLGAESFHNTNKDRRWRTFFASGSEWATAMQGEIERAKGMKAAAVTAAGIVTPLDEDVVDVPAEEFGFEVTKLQRAIFDAIRPIQLKALKRRAARLLPDDQRKLAFEQVAGCKFANTLFAGAPTPGVRMTTPEFQVAAQSALGMRLSCLKPFIGYSLKSNARGRHKVGPYGNEIKTLQGATGGGTTTNHNAIQNTVSNALNKASIPHKGGIRGQPPTCKGAFMHAAHQHARVTQPNLPEDQRQALLNQIIPDIIVDARHCPKNLEGEGAQTLNGIRTMVDFKTVAPGEVYRNGRHKEGSAVVDWKQGRVSRDYRRRCRELDAQMGVEGERMKGPFESTLDGYGMGGTVLVPVVGAFAEMSEDMHILADFVAAAQAERHCARFDEEPAVAKGVFKQRLYREWGHTAHRGWARLLLDRREELIVLPRFGGSAAGIGGEGRVSPEEDLATLFYQHRNSDPGFQPGI